MNRKKIGIITWYGNTTLNYGGALQATAMQAMLKNLGCLPVTINHLELGTNHKAILLELLRRGNDYTKTYIKFQKWYHKHMNLSPYLSNDNEIAEYAKNNCDILLCGSDAIWSETYAVPRFFWDYEMLDDKPRIAYSAGTERGNIGYDISRVINRFIAISGRENIMKKLLADYRTDISVTLDPTLAITPSFWKKLSAPRLINEPYIICYILKNVEYHRVSIEIIAKKHKINKVVYINTDFIDKSSVDIYSDYNGQAYKRTVGPAEFLSLIRYSSAVCTDSFHGSAFSIIFNREFYAFSNQRIKTSDQDHRFANLLPLLNLEDRYMFFNDEIDKVHPIDWNRVQSILDNERHRSNAFLKNAIQKCQDWQEYNE